MWNLLIVFHWPHDRCALGWEYLPKDDNCDYVTIKFYLFIVTLEFDIFEYEKLED